MIPDAVVVPWWSVALALGLLVLVAFRLEYSARMAIESRAHCAKTARERKEWIEMTAAQLKQLLQDIIAFLQQAAPVTKAEYEAKMQELAAKTAALAEYDDPEIAALGDQIRTLVVMASPPPAPPDEPPADQPAEPTV